MTSCPAFMCHLWTSARNWGAVGFARAIPKFDSANSVASLLADQIAKAVATPLVAYGIAAANLSTGYDQDGVPILHVSRGPQDAKIEPLIGNLSLAEGLQILESQMADIREDLPELRMSDAAALRHVRRSPGPRLRRRAGADSVGARRA